jgi:hypothetical protein
MTTGDKFTRPESIEPENNRRQALQSILDRFPGNNALTQRMRMLAAMEETGHITTFEAMRFLDVFDPRPRIFELRRDGNFIQTVVTKAETESGVLHRIGLYFVLPTPQLVLEGI